MSNGSDGTGRILRNLGNSSLKKTSIFDQLASGQKKLNAADIAVVAGLDSQSAVSSQASNNIQIADALNSTQDAAYSSISDILTRQQELATEAANGTYSSDQRASLQNEYSALTDEANRQLSSSQFNGIKLGDSVSVQVGTGSDANSQIQLSSQDPNSVIGTLQSSDLNSQSGAQNALSLLQQASSSIDQIRSTAGANSARLDTADSNIQSSLVGIAQSKSRIQDADVAQLSADQTAEDIKTSIQSSLLAHNKISSGVVSKLLS